MLGPALKRSFLLLVLLAALLVGGLLTYALQLTETPDIGIGAGNATSANNDAATQSLADAGRYVAIAADCAACHTAPDGKPFAGGLPLASPIGKIYSTNITPDRATGIGRYSLKDF
ncbi:MAG TPA: alcohol dehydrogenase, partial [Burkholderiaceae bacterium]|nr:alcohol dehydrogenase [Burkholderiaceae bacterium]